MSALDRVLDRLDAGLTNLKPRHVIIALIIGAVIFAVSVTLLAIAEGRAKEECRENGGRVIENCYWSTQCTSMGKSVDCHPIRLCAWHCEAGGVEGDHAEKDKK